MEEEVFEVELLPDGSALGPDGLIYRQTPKRVKASVGRELVDAGASVVTDVFPESPTWYVGESAKRTWSDIRPRLVVGKSPAVRDLQWVGRVWETEDGVAMLWFNGSH